MLTIENIEVVYDTYVLVLKGLSLQVKSGAVTALLGANGAGKSTTLKAVSGLLASEEGEVTRGRITFDGVDITHMSPDRRVASGLVQVMEGRRIFQDLTVEENIRIGAFLEKDSRKIASRRELVYEYFPKLKERHTQVAGYLSGGEQQMLAIGRALMAGPRIMMLDEPSMGLSPLLVQEVPVLIPAWLGCGWMVNLSIMFDEGREPSFSMWMFHYLDVFLRGGSMTRFAQSFP